MTRGCRIALLGAVLVALLWLSTGSGLGAILVPGEQARQARDPASLVRARTRSPSRYRFARAQRAVISRTPDGRSFYVFWPGGRRGGKVIVTLHGYVVSAIDDFSYWHRYAAPRGYGVLALQWRLGPRSTQSYTPGEIYGQATRILRRYGIHPGQALLHGYSSSAARTYAIAALDRRAARYFRLFVANAGGAHRSAPLFRQVFAGGFGSRPLLASQWVMFCGGRDRAFSTGCALTLRTARMIRRRGGRVHRVIVDRRAQHGGFLANPPSVNYTLGVFARLSGG